ncbi:ABC-three component system protein [Pseudomonas fulva]|uniref:ABC-three component system protein n=1 Tax=Pseudomonas fulva TaxID=47880 RepID=UPI00346288E6
MKDSEASASAAGYGYQYERALYRIFTAPNVQTWFGIETADDVEEISHTATGSRRVSEQAKLSVQPGKNPLQDSSRNLWKTLRIWLNGLAAARREHEELQFLLVTNRLLKKGTLAMRLSDASSKQEVADAVAALRTHASSMTGKTGEIAQDVIAYSDADLAFLIEHLLIEDGQFNAKMKQRVIASLHLPEDAVANAEDIYHGLVGFLFDSCQETWKARKPFWTSAQPYYNKRQTLVDAFMNGPWEPLPFEKTEFAQWAEKIDPADMLFVQQLNKINMPNSLLMKQFSFFCGAYSERIRLLAQGHVLPKDFDSAERVLSDRWEAINDRHQLDTMKSSDQYDIADYRNVMTKTLFPDAFSMRVGRVNSSAQYLFSGTYHWMANGEETDSPIHWHRDAPTPEEES